VILTTGSKPADTVLVSAPSSHSWLWGIYNFTARSKESRKYQMAKSPEVQGNLNWQRFWHSLPTYFINIHWTVGIFSRH